MNREDIRDEGYSTQEDHKRMLPNVETLDLSPYLIGVRVERKNPRNAAKRAP